MLQSSTKQSLKKTLHKKQQIQPDTSQTLTQLPSDVANISINIYNQPTSQSNNFQLIKYTISHSNLDWLHKKLNSINGIGSQQFETGNLMRNSQLNIKNLDQISDQVSQSIKKIAEHRKILQDKIKNYVYLKCKQTDKKNRRKSNLYKYKELLLTIKKLRDQTTNKLTSQPEINEMRNRLKCSGLVLVPSMIEKALHNLAQRAIFERKNILQISNISNLRVIVDHMMNRSSRPGLQGQYEIQNKHILYLKFKRYLLLKNYVWYKQNEELGRNRQLDRLCQENITLYIEESIGKLTHIQVTKIRSLVQCNQLISFYFSQVSKQFILQLLKGTVYFIKNLRNRTIKLQEQYIHTIMTKNKKSQHYRNFSIPINLCFHRQAQNSSDISGMAGIEEIGQLINYIQDRAVFLELFSRQYGIEFKIQQVKIFVLRECLRHILNPILKMIIGIIKATNRNVKQRHYHVGRLMVKNIVLWKQLYSKQNQNKQNQLLREIECKVDEIQCGTMWNIKTNDQKKKKKQKIQKKRNKKQKQAHLTPAQFFIQYHQTFGQVFLYLVNKIAIIPKFNNLNNCADHLINLWLSILSSEIVHHQLEQLLPANILGSLQFMQRQALQMIEQEHKKQNKLDNLLLKTQGKQKKNLKQKYIPEQQKQKLYLQIMELNFKVTRYDKLISLCKTIGVVEEVIKIHTSIFEDTYAQLMM